MSRREYILAGRQRLILFEGHHEYPGRAVVTEARQREMMNVKGDPASACDGVLTVHVTTEMAKTD